MFRTHEDAPRVLIANSNLVPHWANWEHFHELDRKGLMMYGQMTAGSWIYIGSQGIVQGTYETFVEMGRQHYGGDLAGRWILTAGLGGMGGAQPLAATMAGASCWPWNASPAASTCGWRHAISTCEPTRSMRRWRSSSEAVASEKPVSVGLLGNAAEIFPEMVRRGIRPDAVTDQTSAHDPVNGYLPKGWTLAEWEEKRDRDPEAVERRAPSSPSPSMSARCSAFAGKACRPSTTATTSARWPRTRASTTPSTFPGFVPAYIRPLFCRGIGPFRWAALSGDPEDIYRDRPKSEGAVARRTSICTTGSTWRASVSLFRACRPASAGSGSAIATAWGRIQRDGARAAS